MRSCQRVLRLFTFGTRLGKERACVQNTKFEWPPLTNHVTFLPPFLYLLLTPFIHAEIHEMGLESLRIIPYPITLALSSLLGTSFPVSVSTKVHFPNIHSTGYHGKRSGSLALSGAIASSFLGYITLANPLKVRCPLSPSFGCELNGYMLLFDIQGLWCMPPDILLLRQQSDQSRYLVFL